MFNVILFLLPLVVNAGVPDTRAEVAKFLSEIKKTSNVRSKLAVISDFKKILQAKPAPKDIATVYGLNAYLDKIDDDFSTDQCESTRSSIIFAFSPKNDEPDYTPAEAQVALDALAELCKNPST